MEMEVHLKASAFRIFLDTSVTVSTLPLTTTSVTIMADLELIH